MLKYITLAATLILTSCNGTPAYAHEFKMKPEYKGIAPMYDPVCCDQTDCTPVQGVKQTPKGFLVPAIKGRLSKPVLIPYNSKYKLRNTPHGANDPYHVCTPYKDQVQCLYAPMDGS